MSAVELVFNAASVAKLNPGLFDRSEFSMSGAKLPLGRLFLSTRDPQDRMNAGIWQVSMPLTELCNVSCHTGGLMDK